MTMKDLQKCLAEGLGTFYLCFIGIGSILCVTMNDWGSDAAGLLIIALAHGLALSIGVAVTGGISGGHLNPAVTAGMWISKRIETLLAVKYIVSQLIGASLGALLVVLVFQSVAPDATGIPLPSAEVIQKESFPLTVLITEFIMTFLLVISVYSVAVDPRGKAVKIGAFVIGLTIAVEILVAGGISGASMNPARSFGPALVHMDFTLHWCYWVAPLLGGMAAGLFYHHCLLEKDSGEKATAE
jgi:MIP family channel proteins